jgi:hypothetical protein
MSNLFSAVLLTLVFQTAGAVRLGNFAQMLSDQDVAAIEREFLPAGKKTWLLVGPYGQSAQTVAAYLLPDNANGELRRGSLTVVRREPTGNRWSVVQSREWAQVSVTGRDFNAIQDDQDQNRPFTFTGRFEDGELISVVRVLRSSTAVERTWPVYSMSRQSDDSIQAFLGSGPGSLLERVTLKKQGAEWVVVNAQKGRA